MKRPAGYSRLQIRLHWLTVALILVQLPVADGISRAFGAGLDSGRMAVTAGAAVHMVIGALILLTAFLRLAVRAERGVPPPPETDPGWQKTLARTVHAALYAFLALVPITGAMAWGQASDRMGDVHETLKSLLIALVLLHVAGALYGQFVQRTGVIARMLRADPSA